MGTYFPQKLDLLPRLERQYISVQRHVSSYYIKISEDCFVWAAPTLLRGGPYLINADNSLRGANTGEYRCGIEPNTCHSTRGAARLEECCFQILKLNGFPLSIEAHVLPDEINTSLNREGVELPFNQSYRFEVTTVPLRLHYITS
jgi:hypothetical protein